MLDDYVKLVPELYGNCECTINNHMLLHLFYYAKKWGPLWVFSAFGFESMNGQPPNQLADQLLFSLTMSDCIDRMHDKLSEADCEHVSSLRSFNSLATMEIATNSFIKGNMYQHSFSNEERLAIKSAFGIDIPTTLCFSQMYYEATLFQSISYGKN